jgi:hypothetical protein
LDNFQYKKRDQLNLRNDPYKCEAKQARSARRRPGPLVSRALRACWTKGPAARLKGSVILFFLFLFFARKVPQKYFYAKFFLLSLEMKKR